MLRPDEIIVDSFAGGGGASVGITAALGRAPDVAINHDDWAVAMHAANHPETEHYSQNIWQLDPEDVAAGRKVGLLWASPDCTHFSKAKGGKPREKRIRDLAWVVVHWAQRVKPRIIVLENVEEFRSWGPLCFQGRPIKERAGETFQFWIKQLKKAGYKVDYRELRACDYGAPTTRKRLFLIARCDGLPIRWPKPSHGPNLEPYRGAWEIIDWSLPCPSIFLTKEEARELGVKRPLAEKTMARIARGLWRYVLTAADPFVIRTDMHKSNAGCAYDIEDPLRTVTSGNGHAVVTPSLIGLAHGDSGGRREYPIDDPLGTVTAGGGHQHALAAATIVPRYGERPTQDPRCHSVAGPLPTVVPAGNGARLATAYMARHFGRSVGSEAEAPIGAVTAGGGGKSALIAGHITKWREGSSGHCAAGPLHTVTANSYEKRPGGAAPLGVVAASLAQHNGGMTGHSAADPLSTITGRGCHQAPIMSWLTKYRGTSTGQDLHAPAPTLTAGGWHLGEVRAFLQKYYGDGGQDQDCRDPVHTLTARARMGLVVVEGELWQIADIGMRMLTPRELFLAQGFPPEYTIDVRLGTRPITKTEQIAKAGNSVCPPLAEAIIRELFPARQAAPLGAMAGD